MAVRFTQDPDAILDYTLDWSKWLVPDDFLVGATFLPDPGIDLLSSNIGDSIITDMENSVATGWLAHGTIGATYNIVCHITTAHGRQDDRTFQIIIREQ